jgi:hypothetical protein
MTLPCLKFGSVNETGEQNNIFTVKIKRYQKSWSWMPKRLPGRKKNHACLTSMVNEYHERSMRYLKYDGICESILVEIANYFVGMYPVS